MRTLDENHIGYIKITKQRTEKSRFDRNVYSKIAVSKPVEKTENPYPNNSGMEKNASNQGFSPHPNLSGMDISSTEKSGTIINSSNSNSFNKDLDTKDTNKTFLHTSFEHQNEQKTKYMENAFYENHEYVPERLANMLRAFSRTPEQAKEFYNIILIAKKNAEKHTEEMIWLEDEPELLQEIINTFSRAIRKIEKERNVKNAKGYIYKSIFDLLTKEISVRQRQGTNNENLYFNWLEEEDENYG